LRWLVGSHAPRLGPKDVRQDLEEVVVLHDHLSCITCLVVVWRIGDTETRAQQHRLVVETVSYEDSLVRGTPNAQADEIEGIALALEVVGGREHSLKRAVIAKRKFVDEHEVDEVSEIGEPVLEKRVDPAGHNRDGDAGLAELSQRLPAISGQLQRLGQRLELDAGEASSPEHLAGFVAPVLVRGNPLL